jgi:NAD(P)-dependent dehydrogenase (short-subunit alcohol dehydrogenase family)
METNRKGDCMNKKNVLIGGAAATLAGVTMYKLIGGKSENEVPWSTADIPDLTGKVIIVTGANSGIGYEAAKAFARNGAQTILACRNIEKAEMALSQLKSEIGSANEKRVLPSIMIVDLASLDSVRNFASEFKAKYDRLDVLVNNAGIMMVPYGQTEDGFERQFGTNHLGHFALTGLLIDELLSTPGSRVVNVSSTGHRAGKMDFNDPMFGGGKGYSPMRAYGRSKLANLLFTNELQRRFDAIGADVMATAAHPGGSDTNLGNHLQDGKAYKVVGPLMNRMMQSAAMGALPTIRAAVDPDAKGGDYYGPDGFMETAGFPVKVGSSKAARNSADMQRLWQVSKGYTGVDFNQLD